MPQVAIAPVADRPDLVPLLACWYWGEWGRLHPDRSLEDWIEMLRPRDSRDHIPMLFVAVDGETPAGTSSLVYHDMASHPELSPWLAGVYVIPELRGRGIGSALVRQVVAHAGALSVPRLYLHTDAAEGFYARMGWAAMGREIYLGREVTLMTIEPGAAVIR